MADQRGSFWSLIAMLLVALSLAACSSSPSDERHGCDPLAAAEQPITLGAILAIGKDSAGTLYLVDQSGPDYRVFVSSQGSLFRQRIAGSGTGASLYVFHVSDHDPELTLEVSFEGGTTRMGLVTGPFAGKTFVIGQQGEELTVVGDDAIAGMPLRNLPGTIYIEYVAQLDQRVMVVTRPLDDWTYQDFRVFFGPLAGLLERHVSNVSRAKDGGSTSIVFDLDGAQATAWFPVVWTGTGVTPGQATLSVNGTTSDLTRLDTPPTGGQYQCF
jgi:hypothetical protein